MAIYISAAGLSVEVDDYEEDFGWERLCDRCGGGSTVVPGDCDCRPCGHPVSGEACEAECFIPD